MGRGEDRAYRPPTFSEAQYEALVSRLANIEHFLEHHLPRHLKELLMATTDEIQAKIDSYADAVNVAVTELKAAFEEAWSKVTDLPGGIDIDTSRIDSAVTALSSFATDPNGDGQPGVTPPTTAPATDTPPVDTTTPPADGTAPAPATDPTTTDAPADLPPADPGPGIAQI